MGVVRRTVFSCPIFGEFRLCGVAEREGRLFSPAGSNRHGSWYREPLACMTSRMTGSEGLDPNRRLLEDVLCSRHGSKRLTGKKELKRTGFSGTVTNTSLHDIIQLICIGRNSCRMLVRSGTKEGWIFFRDGEIVHAEYTNASGEEAFYSILSWELGVFDCDLVPEKSETIHESWDFLLMESMRRLDTLYSSG